jgi:hypothetical protein
LTTSDISDKIPLVADRVIDMERYRSGHNEAVLKTVCPQGRVGSNPTLSVPESKYRERTRGVSSRLVMMLLDI